MPGAGWRCQNSAHILRGWGGLKFQARPQDQDWTFPFAVNQSRAFLVEPSRKTGCIAVRPALTKKNGRELQHPFPYTAFPGPGPVRCSEGRFTIPSLRGSISSGAGISRWPHPVGQQVGFGGGWRDLQRDRFLQLQGIRSQ